MDYEVLKVESPEVENLDDIGTGRNELVLRCKSGSHKGRFLYVLMGNTGEVIGSGSPESHGVTMVLESPHVSRTHAKILYHPQYCVYLLEDLNSASGTWLKVADFGEKITSSSVFKIAGIDFTVKRGPEIFLQDQWRSLISNRRSFNSLEEALSSQGQDAEQLKLLPRRMASLIFCLLYTSPSPRDS